MKSLLNELTPVRRAGRRFAWIIALIGGLLATHGAASTAPQAPADDEALLEQIAELSKSKRKKLLERCIAAAEASGAPQVALVREWADSVEKKPSRLPEPTEFGAYDARKFKGGPPRRVIGPGRNQWDALDAQIERRPADPRVDAARPVAYEFATGEIVQREGKRAKKLAKKRNRGKRKKDSGPGPEQPFRELLAGILPDQTVAEAALLRALDAGGALRGEAHYFAHLYCDREANAYEGITLFDMWSLPSELEVPDPDARAYAKLIWDDDSVPVPLTKKDHDLWYPRTAKSLRDLRTYMFITRAVAAVWFEGRPELSGGYGNSIDIMNAAIGLFGSDPDQMAEKLRSAGSGFLVEVKDDIEARGNEIWNVGNARRDELAKGKETIREAVLAVLTEADVL